MPEHVYLSLIDPEGWALPPSTRCGSVCELAERAHVLGFCPREITEFLLCQPDAAHQRLESGVGAQRVEGGLYLERDQCIGLL